VLLVPAHRALYGTMDAAVGHHRRYAGEEVARLLARVGFHAERQTFVNAASIPAWLLNGRVLKRRGVPGLQARLANLLVPVYRFEQRLRLPFGLSVIAVATPDASAAARLSA